VNPRKRRYLKLRALAALESPTEEAPPAAAPAPPVEPAPVKKPRTNKRRKRKVASSE